MYVHVKVIVVYHGCSEHVYRLAVAATDGAWDSGAEVRIRRLGSLAPRPATCDAATPAEQARETACIQEVDADDIAWADVVLVGSAVPTGELPRRLAQLLDATAATRHAGELAEKAYGVFTPATTMHGAPDGRVVPLLDLFHHWGGIVIPFGLHDPAEPQLGHPSGGSQLVLRGSPREIELAAARSQGERATETARALKLGRRILADVA